MNPSRRHLLLALAATPAALLATNAQAKPFKLPAVHVWKTRVRHQNADFAFLVKPLPCESTTYAHFCGSFVVATA